MKDKNTRKHNYFLERNTKPQTNKIINKLTYNPAKHKQKFIKKLR